MNWLSNNTDEEVELNTSPPVSVNSSPPITVNSSSTHTVNSTSSEENANYEIAPPTDIPIPNDAETDCCLNPLYILVTRWAPAMSCCFKQAKRGILPPCIATCSSNRWLGRLSCLNLLRLRDGGFLCRGSSLSMSLMSLEQLVGWCRLAGWLVGWLVVWALVG